jgi:WD40 repeat protein
VTGLAFNPKGKRVAVSHYGGATLRWTGKLDQGTTRLEWRGSHIGVTWSPDGATVLTAMQERELHGWRLTDRQTMSMAGYAAKVRSMDWLRRPMILATSGGDCVTAWSFTGGGPMGKPSLLVGSGLGRLVTCVAIHPKMPIVAAGFDEGQVIVCGLSRQEMVVRVRWPDWERITLWPGRITVSGWPWVPRRAPRRSSTYPRGCLRNSGAVAITAMFAALIDRPAVASAVCGRAKGHIVGGR